MSFVTLETSSHNIWNNSHDLILIKHCCNYVPKKNELNSLKEIQIIE